ncbi:MULTISPECIES: hypothetical protein [unclassified Bradyrhizobium]|uniref:hypothetical protein n=1 Tax=unclassified Bradyrhizobium TaxID=2631580 RepID=UPI0028E39C3A|nr:MULTISPECIES: hypothetical protein [unclassified Bradyrhizobium]
MTHACPVQSCNSQVASHLYMCPRHWRMVPKPLQKAVYESYKKNGQVSANHREAVRVVEAAEAGRSAIKLPAGTRALTIYQPWASLIMIGAKPYEFRRWDFSLLPALAKLVGQRIVIHASVRRPSLDELDDILDRIEHGESALKADLAEPLVRQMFAALKARGKEADLHMAPLGVALGTAVIGQPRAVMSLVADQVADSDRLDEHIFGWPLASIEPFPQPVPAAGAQGFWSWS